MPEISIDAYARRLIGAGETKRIPLAGSFELTFRCNNRCAHCYVNARFDDEGEKRRELSHEEICRLLDELAGAGCLFLLLTGGEPLLRDDFQDIYLYAKKKGFLITLFTNGTLITPTLADILQEFPPRFVEITLYGMTDRTYERMTRRRGSYRQCRAGIDLLLSRGIPLKLKTVVTTVNKQEFGSMRKFAEERGLEFRFDALLNERVDRSRTLKTLRLLPEEVVELDLTDPKRRAGFVEFFEKTRKLRPDPKFLFHCGAGVNCFHMDPYGRLMGCMLFRDRSYDLKYGCFDKGWWDFLPQIAKSSATKKIPCHACELVFVCDQCPGWSLLEHGAQEIPVDFLCRIAHRRAEVYGIR